MQTKTFLRFLPSSTPNHHTALRNFCGAVRSSAPEIRFSRRTLGSDLLSLFALGAVGHLRWQGKLSRDEARVLAARMLSRDFRWPAHAALARAEAFFPDQACSGSSAVRRVLERGAAAFAGWQSAPQEFSSFRFEEIIDDGPVWMTHRYDPETLTYQEPQMA